MNDKKSRITLYAIVIVLIIANLAFKFLNDIKIEQTAILFVGIPSLITLLLIKYSKTPKSAYGVVFLTLTLFLLFSSILLGEGLVCIIFMAPIFYAVAGLIVFIKEYLKKKNKSKLNSFVLIPILFLFSQGHKINSTPEVNTIKTMAKINTLSNLKNMNTAPNFLENFPIFFKIGFPKPLNIEGTGINVGDYRKIKFKSNTRGIGTLHLEIISKQENSITFVVINDDTHINHWLTFKEVTITIENDEDNTSTVSWITKFTCDLGPNWYFNPIEKYGVKVMNQHLINSFFVN